MDYLGRRNRFSHQLKDGIFVLVAAPERTRSRDTQYDYRPGSDMLYLSGFHEPEAVLILDPKSETPFTLFVRARDPEMEVWTGRRFGPEGVKEQFGADAAYNLSELDEKMPELLAGHERIYYSLNEDPVFDRRMFGWIQKLRANRKLPNRAPRIIENPSEILHRMRWVKDEDEIGIIRRACQISAQAHRLAIQAAKTGMFEYQIQGIIESHFVSQGALAPSYSTIVASGDNANILHYIQNDQPLQKGDLILVDAGAEFKWYAGDITRTFPVGKTFSAPQRDLYQAVLEAQIKAIDRVRLGTSNHDVNQATIRDLTDAMIQLGLLKGSVDEAIEEETYKRYYMHGTGHYMGLDVHDVGPYFDAKDVGTPYEKGVILTIEPGLYIQANDEKAPKHFRGIGIRIEDDVLVTDGDPEILTSDVPKTIAELEALKKS